MRRAGANTAHALQLTMADDTGLRDKFEAAVRELAPR
jgi:hypothetical protein